MPTNDQRRLVVAGSAYLADCLLCYFGGFKLFELLDGSMWILGPPACLSYGPHYLWAFVTGSAFAVVSMFAVLLGRVRWMQVNAAIVFLLSWALFGALVYAPGA